MGARGPKPGAPNAGRPKGAVNVVGKDLRKAAQQYTTAALKTLAAIMANEDEPSAARVAAANSLLDRGHGKPTQTVDARVSGKLSDLNDEQLAALAAIGATRSGDTEGEEQPDQLH